MSKVCPHLTFFHFSLRKQPTKTSFSSIPFEIRALHDKDISCNCISTQIQFQICMHSKRVKWKMMRLAWFVSAFV